MVVGKRQTSNATSTVIVTGAPCPAARTLKSEYGSSVTVARRNTMVSAASRMSSAISFGVFWRFAPSTIAIIRSRKVSPGLVVIRTMSQSESTRVPPVTALRSPPLSRMTGALSPVMALSSTDATPRTISPSAGTSSPASSMTRSPFFSAEASTATSGAPRLASFTLRAGTSFLAFRSVSACALPRPSAIASAKLAKSTVNQSHSEIARMKPAGASPCPTSAWTKRHVVNKLPTSTTNMTGFRTWWRGSSFVNASLIARRTIGPSNNGRALACRAVRRTG